MYSQPVDSGLAELCGRLHQQIRGFILKVQNHLCAGVCWSMAPHSAALGPDFSRVGKREGREGIKEIITNIAGSDKRV